MALYDGAQVDGAHALPAAHHPVRPLQAGCAPRVQPRRGQMGLTRASTGGMSIRCGASVAHAEMERRWWTHDAVKRVHGMGEPLANYKTVIGALYRSSSIPRQRVSV